MKNMYQKAAELKLRFDSAKGLISVEDLQDLPLRSTNGASLNEVAIRIHNAMESNETLDFIEDKTPTNTTNQLRMDIVKDIIENKLATIAASQQRAENKIQREKIMEILEQKSDSAMLKKTPAELRKMLDKLGA